MIRIKISERVLRVVLSDYEFECVLIEWYGYWFDRVHQVVVSENRNDRVFIEWYRYGYRSDYVLRLVLLECRYDTFQV